MLFSLPLQLLQRMKEYILIPTQVFHFIEHKDMIDFLTHMHLQLTRRVLVQTLVSPHIFLLTNVDVLANGPQQILNGLQY